MELVPVVSTSLLNLLKVTSWCMCICWALKTNFPFRWQNPDMCMTISFIYIYIYIYVCIYIFFWIPFIRTRVLYCSILLHCEDLTLCSTPCLLCATLINIQSSSLYCTYCMFRSNWPSSGVQVAVLKESAALLSCCFFLLCNCLGLFRVIWVIVLFPCTYLVYGFLGFPLVQCVAVLNVFVGVEAYCLAVSRHGHRHETQFKITLQATTLSYLFSFLSCRCLKSWHSFW
jgi:hypothetical protein